MTTLNRSQCHGLDLDRHLIIDAGAGTGKTTVMSIRYIQHLLCEDQRASRLLPKGPREPQSGQGALRIPKRQQQDVQEWNGLLPAETVAVTFTVKAAAELKEKIRSILSDLASTPDGDSSKKVDPRLRKEGFVEQLTSMLESAPIGTIDSFLSRLVAPHMSLVKEIPASENMSEEEGFLLNEAAINLLWSLQSESDALDAGLVGDVLGLIQARDRLAMAMGSRNTAGTIIKGLIKQSLFVEEAEKSWLRNRRRNGGDPSLAISELLLSMVPDLFALSNSLFVHASAWLNVLRTQQAALELAAGLAADTRLRAIDELLQTGPSDDAWHCLLWCHHLVMAMCSHKQYDEARPTVLPKGMTPKGNQTGGWDSGIGRWSSIDKEIREDVKENAFGHIEELERLLSTSVGNRLRLVARAAALYDDSAFPNPAPLGTKMNPQAVDEIPLSAPQESPRMSGDLQVGMMEDLFAVLRAVSMIRVQLKRQSGVHDHSDMQRMAEDLLLTRCPDICRTWYPREMVSALDDLPDEPWQDTHVARALSCTEDERAVADLNMRWHLVQNIRRRFRAFIIDEFQDTNPQQWRLLARLWGRRGLDSGEVAAPEGPWDPTICLVGDVKQSIYRFRQAQVTVMRNAITSIREANKKEWNDEPRTQDLRPLEMSRDPRPPGGGGGEKSTFVAADKYDSTKYEQEHSWWRFDLEDDGSISEHEMSQARSEGHIDLSTNHRTDEGLLLTINSLCEDVFSERHRGLEGSWYAIPQHLRPFHVEKRGHLEWLLPVRRKAEDPGSNLAQSLDPFSLPKAKDAHLENEMIAQRLYCLINGVSTQISTHSESEPSWVQIPTAERVAPEDIMVLLPTRTHIDDLMKRLEAWGIPATADKLGPLLNRPVCRALRSLIGALSNPGRRDLVVSLVRSGLLGWTDSRLTATLSQLDKHPFEALIENARTDIERNLLQRWYRHSIQGDVLKAVEETVNHSDLLLAWPEPSARNEVEMFIELLKNLVSKNGGDLARIHERLEKLSALGKDGPAAKAPALGGCVRLMTIHAAKGLQSKVVVLAGLFQAGRRSVANTTRDHLIVTPELIAGRAKPWKTGELSAHGLWILAESLLEAQSEAETRRLLYVSMTRVKSHLILVGSPGKGAKLVNGVIQVQHRPGSRRSMGTMLLDSMRASAICNQQEHSPWLINSVDGEMNPPQDGSPNRTLYLDPAALRSDSGLGLTGGPRLSIFHDPTCFMTESIEAQSLMQRMTTHQQGLISEPPSSQSPVVAKRRRRIRFAPSSIDTASSCLRRHWLETHQGWPSEPLGIVDFIEVDNGLPDAATLGTLFHRLVEVGLPNPVNKVDSSPDLPQDWSLYSSGTMLDRDVIKQVVEEYKMPDINEDATIERLYELAKILMDGELGQACLSGKYREWNVEGLRTEVPFDLGLLTAENLPLNIWTPFGDMPVAEIESVVTSMTGRIDLVLALANDNGEVAYLVIDLKTRGCGASFNPLDREKGHPLQMVAGSGSLIHQEQELLTEHRMQLALYCLALEYQQASSSAVRRLLPPAIYVAANGRLVDEGEELMPQSQSQLEELLSTLSRMRVLGPTDEQIEPLSSKDAAICNACPHHRGSIKLCGPR